MLQSLAMNVVSGVVLGVTASWLFYFWLSRQTPRIVVCDKIARSRDVTNGVIKHKIKVINKTPVAIVEIKAALHVVCPTEGGYNRTAKLELKADSPLCIGRLDQADETAGYAYRFVVYELEDQIREQLHTDRPCFLRFRLVCRHSFSNFGAFIERDFWLDGDVVDGDFKTGNTFEIRRSECVDVPTVRALDGAETEPVVPAGSDENR